LHSARETAEARTAGIAEYLKSNGQSSRSARALHSLADWWLQDSGRDSESPLAWERPAEAFREELRALPGVSLTLADRILLFVGGLPVFPVDRAALRIACRHGWMEQTAEYDEWQSFFTRESAEARIQLTDLAHWLSAIGGEFCGAKPQCEQCPLRALLPACGPVPLTEGDQDV
jgi:endonuclease-3 related protein